MIYTKLLSDLLKVFLQTNPLNPANYRKEAFIGFSGVRFYDPTNIDVFNFSDEEEKSPFPDQPVTRLVFFAVDLPARNVGDHPHQQYFQKGDPANYA